MKCRCCYNLARRLILPSTQSKTFPHTWLSDSEEQLCKAFFRYRSLLNCLSHLASQTDQFDHSLSVQASFVLFLSSIPVKQRAWSENALSIQCINIIPASEGFSQFQTISIKFLKLGYFKIEFLQSPRVQNRTILLYQEQDQRLIALKIICFPLFSLFCLTLCLILLCFKQTENILIH